MRLINNDGGLDFLRNYGLAGRRVVMLIGNIREAYDTFEPLIVGRMQQVFFNTNDLTVSLRDRLQDLAVPFPTNKFLGNNALPDGLEGVELEDFKDKPKPKLFGIALNISPPCVNTARQIYQANDGPIPIISLVLDKGGDLLPEADYADQADMEANAPTPGYFRAWKDGGYFRLGTLPAGTITCDAGDHLTQNSVAQVAKRLVETLPPSGEGGVDSADINNDDFLALLTVPQVAGIWFSGGETYAQILDQLLAPLSIWYGFDRSGIFRMQRLELPVAPYAVTLRVASTPLPVLALGEYNIIAYRFIPNNDPERGMPTKQVTVDYSRNFTVQPANSLLTSLQQTRRNFLGAAWRTEVSPADTTIEDAYPLAVDKEVKTLLIDQSAAVTEAARLLAIFREPRDFLEVDLILTSDLIALVDIGSVVNIDIPRFDYDGGKLMRVIGMQYNAAAGMLTLSCWG
jgi:hypothetical protein